MTVDRDAAAVVVHGDGIVGVDGNVDRVTVAGERLVDRVVHHLVYQVVQPVLAGRPDVHAGALAHRIQSFQDLDRVGLVSILLPVLFENGALFFGHGLRHLELELSGPVSGRFNGPGSQRISFTRPVRPALSRARILGAIRLSSVAHAAVITRTRSTPSGVIDSGAVTAAIWLPTSAAHSSMMPACCNRLLKPDCFR